MKKKKERKKKRKKEERYVQEIEKKKKVWREKEKYLDNGCCLIKVGPTFLKIFTIVPLFAMF